MNNTLRSEAVARAMAKNKSTALSAMSSAFDALLFADEEDQPVPPPPVVEEEVEIESKPVEAKKPQLSPNTKKRLIEEKMTAWAGSAAPVAEPPRRGNDAAARRVSDVAADGNQSPSVAGRRVSVPAIPNFDKVFSK